MLTTLAAPNKVCRVFVANLTLSAYTTVVTAAPLALTVARNCFITVFIGVSVCDYANGAKPFGHSVSLAQEYFLHTSNLRLNPALFM